MNISTDKQRATEGKPARVPSVIARMPTAVFVVVCALTGLLAGSAIFIVVAVVEVIVASKSSTIGSVVAVSGFFLCLLGAPIFLGRRRRSELAKLEPPQQPKAAALQALSFVAMELSPPTVVQAPPLMTRQDDNATEPAIDPAPRDVAQSRYLNNEKPVASVNQAIAGPEELRFLLDVNQNRRAAGFLFGIASFGVLVAGAWADGITGNPNAPTMVAYFFLSFTGLFLLLVRKTKSVYWCAVPDKFVVATERIAALRNVKGASEPRFRMRLRKSVWGMKYNFSILSILAEDRNQFWPRLLIICPDYSYWRVGFIFSRGGWKVIKTSDLRVRNFYSDVPAPLLNWGQKIVGRTWEHATKSGDRDYRFKSNRAIDLVRRYGVEIKVADGSEWSFTATEQGREIAMSSMLDIISAAKAIIGQPASSLRK